MTKQLAGHQLTVVGASHGGAVDRLHSAAFELGIAVAKLGGGWLLPTMVGLPHRVAQGAKSVDGLSIGISPAASKLVHDKKYRLPNANFDTIIYTGQPIMARDNILLTSADAVIFIGDQACSPQLLAAALEIGKPIGVLLESDSSSWYDNFLTSTEHVLKQKAELISDQNPKKLISRLAKQLAT